MSYIVPALFLIFVTLKLVGVIAWSWWLVCAPLYPAAAILVIFGLTLGVAVKLDK